ncbi:MAG: type II CAAX endopeptidase family protein [Balneolaceae bacterium]
MINPIFNPEELRLRAFFRIILFTILFITLTILPFFIPIEWAEYVMRSVLILGLYYIMIKYVDFRPWSESGLIFDHTWSREFIVGIGIAGSVMGLIFLVEWLTGSLTVTGFGWHRNGNIYWMFPVLAFLIQMASVGFYEEVMARGYILRNLAEGFSVGTINPVWAAVIAVIISSAIFGVGHAGNPNVTMYALLNIFFAGIMLAIPFIITGRLALSVGMHFSWNFFQGGIFGFRVSGRRVRESVIQIHQEGADWWTGGLFGPEGGLIGVLGILLIILLLIVYFRIKKIPLRFATSFSKSFTEKREN